MAWREAGGIWKEFVSHVFMEAPCWTENVWSCAKMVLKIIVQANMGITESIIFTCSTCFTVQSFHGLSSLIDPNLSSSLLMQALSRNL